MFIMLKLFIRFKIVLCFLEYPFNFAIILSNLYFFNFLITSIVNFYIAYLLERFEPLKFK